MRQNFPYIGIIKEIIIKCTLHFKITWINRKAAKKTQNQQFIPSNFPLDYMFVSQPRN